MLHKLTFTLQIRYEQEYAEENTKIHRYTQTLIPIYKLLTQLKTQIHNHVLPPKAELQHNTLPSPPYNCHLLYLPFIYLHFCNFIHFFMFLIYSSYTHLQLGRL
jgi:hypothetical protein